MGSVTPIDKHRKYFRIVARACDRCGLVVNQQRLIMMNFSYVCRCGGGEKEQRPFRVITGSGSIT